MKIISEFSYRFTHKELTPLFVQLSISDWIVFCTLTVLVGARQHKRESSHNYLIMALFIPIHLAYIIIIFMGIAPGWHGSSQCSASVIYPNIMIANDVLFASVYLLALVFHWRKYFINWGIVEDKDSQLSIQ